MSATVAIQGHAASFHEIAANEFFGNTQSISCDTFGEVFDMVVDDMADYGVVAIENSLYGSINQVYDLLLKHHVHIVGEVFLRIEQCLIGLPNSDITQIKEVHSHPVALAQCETFLDNHLPRAERLEHHDTAASVEDIKNWGDSSKAAIAGRAAAELHNMKIIASGIETNKANYTRFVVLSKNPVASNPSKTSLIITTSHDPGSLYNALGTFAQRGINLSKLQSRPIIGQAWHYMFYVDVSCASDEDIFSDALHELERQKCEVTILGSYPAGNKAL